MEIRFECQPSCSRCCETHGWVYLTEDDLRRAAAHLGVTPAVFETRYVYRTRHRLRLRQPRGKACHFLDGGRCSIHKAKPTQCRLFPFWPEFVGEREAWRRTASWCPGIGKGELVQIGDALEIASEMQRAYPSSYK